MRLRDRLSHAWRTLLHVLAIQELPRAWVTPPTMARDPAPSPTAIPSRPTPPPGCQWCGELLGDSRHPLMRNFHVECAVRVASGSISHLEQRCSCFVAGGTDTDPPELTPREAAMLVYRFMRAKIHGPPN